MRELAASDLFRCEQPPAMPVVVVFGDRRVELTEVYRYLPGRRLVGRGVHAGGEAVFKLFSSRRKASREYAREQAGLRALRAAGVAAPQLIESWRNGAGSGLVLEKLAGRTALELLAGEDSDSQRRALIADLLDWVIAAQRRGCVQEDIHLGNFIMTGAGWHMLDAGACRVGVTARRAHLNNLAWLLAQFPPAEDEWLLARVVAHGVPRDALSRRLLKVRNRRLRKLLKKTERNCTGFLRLREGNLRGSARRDAWPALREMLRQGAHAEGQVLKDGASARVTRDPATGWVVKRYNVKSFWHRVKRQMGITRAKRSWRAAHLLRLVGIPVPAPVAYLEARRGVLKEEAWFIAENAPGVPLHRLVREKGLDSSVVDALRDVFVLMYRFGISHGDMKASNILVEGGTPWLIDLDAVRRHRHPAAAHSALRRDLLRLLANWPAESDAYRSLLDGLCRSPDLAIVLGGRRRLVSGEPAGRKTRVRTGFR